MTWYVGLLAVLLAIHLMWEGAHWQMYPTYLAIAVVLFMIRWNGERWLRIAGSVVIFVLCGASCVVAWALPMFVLPAPTGQFLIGTEIVPMIDHSRYEQDGADRKAPREMVVQLWYPAANSANGFVKPRAPYRRRSETSFTSSYQSVDWTHAHYDVPVATAGGPFPLVLYNPGWNGRRTQDSFLMEELASHGYVVAAIDHPDNSGPVDLGGGRVIRAKSTPEFSDDFSSKEVIYALIDREVEKDTADTLFALSQLKLMNSQRGGRFSGAIDLGKIGALGYSLGGAVAAEAAFQDQDIQAVIDLDTPLYGEAGRYGITQRFLFLGEELSHSTVEERSRMSFGQRRNLEMDEDDYARQLPMLSRSGDYQVVIHGTLHTSFQDGILTSPLRSISGVGSIDADRMVLILRAYTLAFFEQTLRGIASPLLAGHTSPFPEAAILFPSATDHPSGQL